MSVIFIFKNTFLKLEIKHAINFCLFFYFYSNIYISFYYYYLILENDLKTLRLRLKAKSIIYKENNNKK